MKKITRMLIALLIMALATPVYADRGRGGGHGGGHGRHGGTHFGIFLSPGWWGPGWWGPRYPYYPYYQQPPIIIQQPREEYVPPPPAEEQQYWYYCPDPQGYYPYVKTCPKGWLKVVPSTTPPDGEE
ncbi:hypothetical protein [Geobacter sp. DSM 9736]|uniref:hypothetical protein n=1 Tax=Geobacter sp. DSM 9736 TaxID=1277350 RepID=UPI000B5072F0|nr:hypothetical protein [Geobacter sp. DSM 9736]SNB47239.1 hypothetical protein SAMN06269301_2717 [Geobacter sp. DSM 9736]